MSSEESGQTETLSDEEQLAVHKDIFKSGIAVKVDETPEQYKERVNGLWATEQVQRQERVQTEKQSEGGEITENVSKWLGHSLTEAYARRYKDGESLGSILEGQKNVEDKGEAIKILAELLVSEKGDNRSDEKEVEVADSNESVSSEGEEPLTGWAASYELAKIAQSEEVDLSTLTREAYAQYAIDHGLKIDDDQLRCATWTRMGLSPEEIIVQRKAIEQALPEDLCEEFYGFCEKMKVKATDEDRYVRDNIRVRQGTKDSESWLFFGINENASEKKEETHKAYLTFKDLSTFTPDHFMTFLEVLRDSGYNGDVKTFQDMGFQGVSLNDQVVMHGASIEDVELATETAQQFFGGELADVGTGKDEIIDGESKSYSQILANKIAKETSKQ